MLEQKIKEIEEVVEEKKEAIRKDINIKEKKIDFVKHIFYENYKIMADYVKKRNIPIKEAFNDLTTVINSLSTPLYIEANDGKTFTLNEVNELLSVKLGYYQVYGNTNIDNQEPIEPCSLELTPKGNKIYSEYLDLK